MNQFDDSYMKQSGGLAPKAGRSYLNSLRANRGISGFMGMGPGATMSNFQQYMPQVPMSQATGDLGGGGLLGASGGNTSSPIGFNLGDWLQHLRPNAGAPNLGMPNQNIYNPSGGGNMMGNNFTNLMQLLMRKYYGGGY